MQRREFLKVIGQVGLGVVAMASIPGALARKLEAAIHLVPQDFKTFAFYQGLGPTERRSASRSDGTASQMPCISHVDVEEGLEKTYEFWHGHGGKKHSFTITEEDFLNLQQRKTIEIYTDIIEGHRHALKIEVGDVCLQ